MPLVKPYQTVGAQFLAARTRALLADEPGVGKTAQVVLACDLVNATRVRVVCPGVAMRHWEREFAKWSPRRDRRLEVISWDEARRIGRRAVKRCDVLALDECHYGKNPAAGRTLGVFGKGGLGYYADRIWALSGTPMPNHPGELWPMLRAFGATKMDYQQWVQWFCIVDWEGKIKGAREDHVEELRDILRSRSLRRTKAQVLPELGEIDVQEWYVEPSARFCFNVEPQAEESALRSALAGLSSDELLAFLASHDHEFATLRRYNALMKTPAVFETVKFELENGLLDKIVIYGYHPEALDMLAAQFKAAGIDSVTIHGGVPMAKRDGLVQHWKRSACPVLLASIIAAGVSLDFTEAHQGIMVELDWVNGNNQQAMQRMHRIGQDKSVTMRVAIGSEVDETISKVLIRKAQDCAAVWD